MKKPSGGGTTVAAASLFDFSNYHPSHPCYSPSNKKIPGKMKDELLLLDNRVRFIGEVTSGSLVINNKKKAALYCVFNSFRLF